MPEEALLTAVLHLDWPPRAERQKTTMHLQTDVLACTKGTSDTPEDELDGFFGKSQAISDLLAILVQPLRGDVQLD